MPESRRQFLRVGGGAALGLVLLGCDEGGSPVVDGGTVPSTTAGDGAADPTALTADDFAGLGTCEVAPEQTEGPFYADDDLVRRDITEGLTGHPLRVGLLVVDERCTPLPGAAVDLWHCDVDGDYSAYADGNDDTRGDGDGGDGTLFLRGTQVANGDGIVEFVTIYPGWYQGRTVHLHLKVHVDDTTVLTSQLYFTDEQSDEIFTEALYSAGRGERDVRNADDGIFGGSGDTMTTRPDGSGLLALAIIGVAP